MTSFQEREALAAEAVIMATALKYAKAAASGLSTGNDEWNALRATVRAALAAQPVAPVEARAVAWMLTDLDGTPVLDGGDLIVKPRPFAISEAQDCVALYLATPTEAKQEDAPSPEQAEDAARLTDEQIDELWDWAPDYEPDPNQVLKRRAFARSIAARKEG